MNAIILSAQDAAFIARPAYDEETAAKKFDRIRYGTPGYSWLSVVPDEAIQAMQHIVNGTALNSEMWMIKEKVDSEIDRRDNLKSTKD